VLAFGWERVHSLPHSTNRSNHPEQNFIKYATGYQGQTNHTSAQRSMASATGASIGPMHIPMGYHDPKVAKVNGAVANDAPNDTEITSAMDFGMMSENSEAIVGATKKMPDKAI
jgi:hypothetical protein